MPPSQGLMYEFGVLIECSGTPLKFSPCFTFHLYLLHSRIFTSSATHLYQKDERALPGDLPSRKLSFCPPPPNFKCSVSHYPSTLSLRLQRVKHLDSLLVKTRDASSMPAPHVPVYRGRLWHTHIPLPRTRYCGYTEVHIRWIPHSLPANTGP
jgi:hypothetical protein